MTAGSGGLASASLALAGLALAAADAGAKAKAPPQAPQLDEGGHYHKESAYSSTASYGAPHFLILCILLVFAAAGCYEAYLRYGSPEANRKKKKKHNAVGGYGAVTTEEEGDEEAPSLMGDLKGLVGGGAGAAGKGVGSVTGGLEKGIGIFANAAKSMTADLGKAGTAAAEKAKSGVSDAVNVSAHMEKVKKGASIVGNVASAAAADAKSGAEAAAAKGLDTARSAADVNAHLEKAKAAAATVGNVAAAAASDAAKASQDAASAGLSSAREGLSKVGTPVATPRSGSNMELDKKTVSCPVVGKGCARCARAMCVRALLDVCVWGGAAMGSPVAEQAADARG